MKDLQALTEFFNKKASMNKKNEPLVQEVNIDEEGPINQLMY